jgi:glutamyl-Q tRNA(Asp) synthetase
MMVRTRFAPSPTGRLHLGHALAALVAHDLAREQGGVFGLRHEDIDVTRVRDEYYAGIEEDLRWLGLDWDGEALRQSTRIEAYEAALGKLREQGLVYPCFCTRREIQEEVAAMTGAPQGPEGPLYPGTCRELGLEESRQRLAAGTTHAWRLDAQKAARITGPLTFTDIRHGTLEVNPGLLGDVILARKDIGTAYHLAVVVDDAYQTISHVTRGEDLLPATHVQRVLQDLLGLPVPVYLHHALVLDERGRRLAKRHDALSIAAMRQAGMSAAEVLAQLRPWCGDGVASVRKGPLPYPVSRPVAESNPAGSADFVPVGSYAELAQAFEMALVILAMRLACQIEKAAVGGGYVLLADPGEVERIMVELAIYEQEQAVPAPVVVTPLEYDSGELLTALWVLSLCVTFWLQREYPWIEARTVVSTQAIFGNGEWWRVISALFLHADLMHLLSNIASGVLFGTWVCRSLGPWLGWALILMAGALGNGLNAASRMDASFMSLGASTAVFGALGILTGYAIFQAIRDRAGTTSFRYLVPFGGGLVLLSWMGVSSDPRIDVGAHVCGFGVGIVLGLLAAWGRRNAVKM